MAIQIVNKGKTISLTNNGKTRFIIKANIKEVTVVRTTMLRIDIGENALKAIYIDQKNVVSPEGKSAEDLRDAILAML